MTLCFVCNDTALTGTYNFWPTLSLLVSLPIPVRRSRMGAGACGYVGKGGDATELLRAVRDAARGRRYLANSIAQHLALSGIDGGTSPFDGLSPREMEVALLLAQGLRQEQIARRWSLSAKTVNTHKSRKIGRAHV